MFSEKIYITKNKDVAGQVYYTAHLGNQIGGGSTRNEAKDELIKNVVCFMDYLEKENFRLYNEKEHAEKILRMSSNEQTREIIKLKQQLAGKEEEIQQWKTMAEKSSNLLDNFNLRTLNFIQNGSMSIKETAEQNKLILDKYLKDIDNGR